MFADWEQLRRVQERLFYASLQMVEEWKVRRAVGASEVPVTLGPGAGVGACDSDGEAAPVCPAGGGAGTAMAGADVTAEDMLGGPATGGGGRGFGAVRLVAQASNTAA